jgi:hypothetical protein
MIIDEFNPIFSQNKTFDLLDILAILTGSLITFMIFRNKLKNEI